MRDGLEKYSQGLRVVKKYRCYCYYMLAFFFFFFFFFKLTFSVDPCGL